jgi:hypothetical protein
MKLTPEKVKILRQLWDAGGVDSQAELAKAFNISRNSCNRILRGLSWPEAGGPIIGRTQTNGTASKRT